MDPNAPADIRELRQALEAAERDAAALVAGLSEQQGTWRARAGSWSIAECLDHLATGNRVYLRAMEEPAQRARAGGKGRRRPAKPGVAGRLFLAMLEPPPKWWSTLRAPRKIRPRAGPPLADAYAAFVASQADVYAFLGANAHLDLPGVRFPNPFVRGIRFSLATGLHVIATHERRHLWQAWGIRRAVEGAGA